MKEAQKESYEERKRELNMAVVLLCVVILFITCQTIKIIPDIYEALYCSTEEVRSLNFCSFIFTFVNVKFLDRKKNGIQKSDYVNDVLATLNDIHL